MPFCTPSATASTITVTTVPSPATGSTSTAVSAATSAITKASMPNATDNHRRGVRSNRSAARPAISAPAMNPPTPTAV